MMSLEMSQLLAILPIPALSIMRTSQRSFDLSRNAYSGHEFPSFHIQGTSLCNCSLEVSA